MQSKNFDEYKPILQQNFLSIRVFINGEYGKDDLSATLWLSNTNRRPAGRLFVGLDGDLVFDCAGQLFGLRNPVLDL
jgi:choline kinase